ncbi:MAG: S8 family serine peptidase [Bacteroidota bacterium]
MKTLLIFAGFILLHISANIVFAGNVIISPDDSVKYMNWYNMHPKTDKVMGVGANLTYSELLKDRTSVTVVVAVIDSGVDIEHEDLKDVIWTNEDEIPDNGKDDDYNGFIDDIHGWNFIGNSDGENINHENTELTRIIRKYSERFGDREESDIPDDEKEEYKKYLEYIKTFDKELKDEKDKLENLQKFENGFTGAESIVLPFLKDSNYTIADLKGISSTSYRVNLAKDYLITILDAGWSKKGFYEYKKHVESKVKYVYNPDFDARKIIGDNPDEFDHDYGNNDVKGVRYDHGTHVAGIIGAKRDNGIGIDGIAGNVRLMILRVVPDGDEYDKDVANAIIYSVDNGAQIINMSFGKDYSPQKFMVDSAIRYAESKGVLLIHASGNEATDNDVVEHYPTKKKEDGVIVSNWITVGASSIKSNKYLPGIFSNYGDTAVDLFAPGVNIISCKPGNKYEMQSGTSMACPVTTGVAAALWSYFPELSVSELIDVMMKSVYRPGKMKVLIPDTESPKRAKVRFSDLCVSEGIISLYNAVQLILQMESNTTDE